MNAPSPVIHCPTPEQRASAGRALYALGYMRLGQRGVERGISNLSDNPDRAWLVAESDGPDKIIRCVAENVWRQEGSTQVNSVNHLTAYIRRHFAPRMLVPPVVTPYVPPDQDLAAIFDMPVYGDGRDLIQ